MALLSQGFVENQVAGRPECIQGEADSRVGSLRQSSKDPVAAGCLWVLKYCRNLRLKEAGAEMRVCKPKVAVGSKLKSSALREISDFSAYMRLCAIVIVEERAASVRSVIRGEAALQPSRQEAVLSFQRGVGAQGQCSRQCRNPFGSCHGAGEVGLMIT